MAVVNLPRSWSPASSGMRLGAAGPRTWWVFPLRSPRMDGLGVH